MTSTRHHVLAGQGRLDAATAAHHFETLPKVPAEQHKGKGRTTILAPLECAAGGCCAGTATERGRAPLRHADVMQTPALPRALYHGDKGIGRPPARSADQMLRPCTTSLLAGRARQSLLRAAVPCSGQ